MQPRPNGDDTDPAWYNTAWQSIDSAAPWTQRTLEDADFVCECADIAARPVRVLDLACGTGRHSIELARRGHSVVAVDLQEKLLEVGRAEARRRGLAVEFLQSDVRNVPFESEFDVVLNLWEGAIGYLENDAENERHFEAIARALVPGGHHIAGPLYNADWVARSAPAQLWYMSRDMALLSRLEWSPEPRQIIDTCTEFRRDDDARWSMTAKPAVSYRIYAPSELRELLAKVGLHVVNFYAEPSRAPEIDDRHSEFWIHSRKAPAGPGARR